MRKCIIVYIALNVLLLVGCGHIRYYNSVPDDAISEAIYNAVEDDVYYLRKENNNDKIFYKYLIREERGTILKDIAIAVNETIKTEKITDAINIDICYEVPGGTAIALRLQNYTEDEIKGSECVELEKLIIRSSEEMPDDYICNDPVIYTIIPNIKYLEINESIQEKAEEQGIDWYDYWPDLEYFEVFSYDD